MKIILISLLIVAFVLFGYCNYRQGYGDGYTNGFEDFRKDMLEFLESKKKEIQDNQKGEEK